MRYAEPINFIQMMLQAYVEQFKETNPIINISLANESSKQYNIIVQALKEYDTLLTAQESVTSENG